MLVCGFLNVFAGRDHESKGSARRIIAALARFQMHKLHNNIDQRTRGEILAGPRFLFPGVFLKQPFVKVAEAFLFCVVPVNLSMELMIFSRFLGSSILEIAPE